MPKRRRSGHHLTIAAGAVVCIAASGSLVGCGGSGSTDRPAEPRGSRTDNTGGGQRPSDGGTGPLRVVRVVDGDTIVVSLDGESTKVRYIGVDTPESVKPGVPVQCFAKRATALNRSLVEGRTVTLRFDRERYDRYGRVLAYVRNDRGVDVNASLIEAGAARTMAISPNTSRASTFSRLEARARSRQRGMWRECSPSQGQQGSLVLSTR